MPRLDGQGRLRVPLYNPDMVFVGEGYTGTELRDVFYEAFTNPLRLIGFTYELGEAPGRPGYVTPMLFVDGWRFDLVDTDGTLCAFPPYPGQGEERLPDQVYPRASFLGTHLGGQPTESHAETVYGIMNISLHGAIQSLDGSGRPGRPIWRTSICDALLERLMHLHG